MFFQATLNCAFAVILYHMVGELELKQKEVKNLTLITKQLEESVINLTNYIFKDKPQIKKIKIIDKTE